MRKSVPAHLLRFRALVVGLLLIPPNSLWVIQMEKVRQGPYPTTISLFANSVFILALLLIGNALVRRIRTSWALSQSELLVAYTMVAIGSALAGHDFIPILVMLLPHPFWFGSKENRWLEMFGKYLPEWATVRDKAALTKYYAGNSSLYKPLHIEAWLEPALWWSAFIIALGVVMMCMSIIARGMWVNRERLTYPIIELPLQMTSPSGALWRNKLLWGGLILAASIDIINGFSFLYPAIPSINVKHVDYGSFPNKPLSAMGWLPISFYPFAIGLGYLLPVDLLFSCWFFYLFFKMEMVAASAMAWDTPDVPWIREQNYGAYIAIAVILIYNGRFYLKNVAKRALGLESEADDSEEGLSYRACLALIGLASLFLIWFVTRLGLSMHIAVAAIAMYFVFSLVITRIRAELGPPVHDQHFSGPDIILTQGFGTANFSAQDLTAINWFGWFNRAFRGHPMPILSEGLRAASNTQSSQRRWVAFMMIAFVVGTFAAFWAFLHCAYVYGAGAKMVMGHPFGEELSGRLAGWMNNPLKPNIQANLSIAFGFVVALVLGIVRSQVFGFPFHPIGFAISGSWSMNLVWTPLFFAWVAKSVILHYGGLRSYRQFMPFFLGLILGQCIVGSLWSLIGLALGIPTYSFWGA